ncbi:MAG: hypothetical protein H7070_03205, partial [Saprospiraceae bacterium]|nr:hypothetical protein [Pyrinomonadaceae bacterium]
MQSYKRVEKNLMRVILSLIPGFANRPGFGQAALFCVLIGLSCFHLSAQDKYDGREISEVTVAFEQSDKSVAESEEFRLVARNALGSKYTTVKIRDAIEQLYSTKRIASVAVEATEAGADRVNLRFLIKRKTQAQKVAVVIVDEDNSKFTEQELLFKLNLLEAGTAITEQTLRNNADIILEYLRDRGYFKAEVAYEQTRLQSETEVSVTFRVTTNAQATVDTFRIAIDGFDPAKFADKITLKPGEPFSRETLTADVEKIREVLRDEDLLAPQLSEPRVVYESEKNAVSIELTGKKGPIVEVVVESEDKVGKGTQNTLLPVKREGTLDYAAIIEGERRLENYYQERGYFFVNVTSVCSVEPPLMESESSFIKNDTEFLCSALNNAELTGKKVEVKYLADLNRKLRLVDIRLEGTDQFSITDIKAALETQEANILGIIPLFGYGRGYTSEKLLEEDAATIRSLLRELGYRDATVRVNQGVSPDGENLIITFIVEQGPPTVVSGLEITGNTAFSDDELLAQIPVITGRNFSRAKIRNAQRKLSQFYSQAGYYDAVVSFSIDERTEDPATGKKLFKVAFNVENEGKKVYINRVLVSGNEKTKTEAVLRALTLSPNEILRAGDIYTSEQNLYSSDAFSGVSIKPRPAGERSDGSRITDIIINVTEQAPRILSYGGGFSTDLGANGFVDIRHLNLLGRLWQGGARLKVSQRQQLAQLDFVNPRFLRDGEKRFAPLTLSAQYQRDSTVTRFFRSTFDKGTFGIVQRVDEDGNPID